MSLRSPARLTLHQMNRMGSWGSRVLGQQEIHTDCPIPHLELSIHPAPMAWKYLLFPCLCLLLGSISTWPGEAESPNFWVMLDLGSVPWVDKLADLAVLQIPWTASGALAATSQDYLRMKCNFYLYPGLVVDKMLLEVREHISLLFVCLSVLIIIHLALWSRKITKDKNLITLTLKFQHWLPK